MIRLTSIPEREIEDLRSRYRTTRSPVEVVRYIIRSGIEEKHGDHQLVIMDAFLLKHSQMRHFMIWLDDEDLQRVNGYLTNEELDKRMCEEIDSARPLWDKAASVK